MKEIPTVGFPETFEKEEVDEYLAMTKTIQKFLISRTKENLQSPLINHKISPEYRTKMLDWLIEVTTAFKCRERTYFLAAKLFDDYLRKCSNL